jgi:hypothetical protein
MGSDLPCPRKTSRNARLGLLAGRPNVSMRSKDGRSQRRSLAHNLPANAADIVEAVHAAENGELNPARQGEKGPFGVRIAVLRRVWTAPTGGNRNPSASVASTS